MQFVTYNIRYDSRPDSITVKESLNVLSATDPLQEPEYLSLNNEQRWSLRRLRIAEILLKEDIAVIGFQEALKRQVNDLAELLGEEWKWIGVGRDNGVEKGEFSPIFYKHANVKCVSSDTFWLSETPFTPSKYPGAGSVRICTVGHFILNARSPGSQEFTVLNTHLDDRSDMQRQLAASLLLRRACFESLTNQAPIFILGDFNSPAQGLDSAAYQILTGEKQPISIPESFATKFPVSSEDQTNFRLVDLRSEAPRRSISSNFSTFTGFGPPTDSKNWSRIDFIFGGSNKGWTVKAYDVKTSLFDDGVLASDHRPVFVNLKLSFNS